jgi:uncharacterized protein DUF3617
MRLIPLVAMLTLSTALTAVDKVQSLKVKVGLWEVTTTVMANTEMPIPAGLLEKLTPEQRARVQERMTSRSPDAPPRVTTRRYCLTEQQLKKGPTFDQDGKSCRQRSLTSSDRKVDMHVVDIQMECFDHDIKRDETLRIEALSSESVKGFLRFSATDTDHDPNSIATFIARWIGSSCSPSK